MDEARTDRGVRVAQLSSGLAVLAVALLVTLPSAERSRPVPWYALAVAFVLGELVVVYVQVRRESVCISFGEIPIVLGLAYTEPRMYVLAAVVGLAGVLVVHRRQRGSKLAFNVALFMLEATVVQQIYLGIAHGSDPAGALAVAATLGAVVVSSQVGGLAITAVLTVSTGRLDRALMKAAATSNLMAAVANASVGLLVVVLIERDPAALVLLAIVFLVIVAGYRAYATLSTGHARLTLLYRFTRAVAAQVDTAQVIDRVLHEARDVLQSGTALVVLRGADGRVQRSLQLDDSGVRSVELAPGDAWWDGAENAPVVVGRGTSSAVRLESSGLPDALAVPLQAAGAVIGVLAVAHRPSFLPTYGAQDVPLFQSLADHAAVALHNGGLLDELREQAAEREHQALHDQVTGLSNRRGLRGRLEQLLTQGGPVGVLVLDLIDFGQINDAFGYEVGDRLLAEVGRRLALGSGSAQVARLGNDEFAVLLSDRRLPLDLTSQALRVLAGLEEVLLIDELCVEVHVHAGLSTAPLHGQLPEDLLRRADSAMSRAKLDGHHLAVYEPDHDNDNARRLRIVADLRSALAAAQLTVSFQPKCDAPSGRPLGAEALARWEHPELGPICPDEFIPLAEHSGLIGDLTAFVLATALGECAGWRYGDSALSVAVNLSTRCLLDPELPAQVEQALARAGVPAGQLTLEITESDLMQDMNRAARVLHGLRACGVRLSIDDFGTGYSSLSYLKHLPVDEMKLDKSFIQGMQESCSDAAIVTAAVELGHALGLTVVAEGVEDLMTSQRLVDIGVDVLQGYLLSRPVPAPEFRRWLGERAPLPAQRGTSQAVASSPEQAR